MVGRLTSSASMNVTSNDNAIIHFTLAITTRKKDGNDWVDDPCFMDVTFFGQRAKSILPFLNKGALVGVVGELNQRKWEQDGQKRSRIEVIASNVHILETKSMAEKRNAESTAEKSLSSSSANISEKVELGPDDFEDDVPF